MPKKVIVIGGGVGGLSGAIRLAQMGYKVDLYEKNRTLGGKMGQISFNGYTFDTGPTLLTMPFVLDDLFQFTGNKMSDYIELLPVEPVCRYFYNNMKPFDASSNMQIMQNNIECSFSDSPKNYNRFIKYAERIYKKTSSIFIFSPIHEIRKNMTWKHIIRLLTIYQIDPFRTVHQSVKRFFNDTRLIQIFDRYSTYNGSDPYRAPATLNIIPYVELGLGGYYIKGGLYQLIKVFITIAKKMNINLHTEKKIDKILHNKHRIKGVMIDGEKMDTDILLCNNDVVCSFNDLIDGFPKIKEKLNRLEPSLSGVIFYWGIKQQFPKLKQHNIIFSQNYKKEFKQIFQDLKIPDDPTIYIAISSKSDQTHAPHGCENWFVMINAPYLSNNQKWDKSTTDRIRRTIIKKLKNNGIDIEGKINCEKIMTPIDIENQFFSNRGSIYGISSNTMNSAFKRPPNRSRQLHGLYFAGSSSHPGGGVPMCILSGKIAAELINQYESN